MSTFWASWTPCYNAKYDMYLRLLYFQYFEKILDGYQIGSLKEELGLWSMSQLSLWIWSFRPKNIVSICCLLSKVVFFILSTLYIKHCLLILPLFVAIRVIWLSWLTYDVNLVLFWEPGATVRVVYIIWSPIGSFYFFVLVV